MGPYIAHCQRVRAAPSFAQRLLHEIVGREGDSLIGRFVVHTLGFETAARPRWREPAQQAEQSSPLSRVGPSAC
jgi:hypothetical protein